MELKSQSAGYFLSEVATYKLLEEYRFPIAPYRVINRVNDDKINGLKYPLVLKVVSPDIPHKSDLGGIKLNISSREEVISGIEEMTTSLEKKEPDAKIEGFLLQEMVQNGHQMILGLKQDPIFGTLLMVGMGGIFVELLKDVSWRLAPIDLNEAKRMLQQLKAYPILEGIRGQKKSDIDGLADLLVKLGQFGLENPRITELDINPVFVREDDLLIADALAWIQGE